MEKFFLIGCQVNEIEIKELLLKRYGRFDFPEMEFEEFIEFIVLAINKDREDKMPVCMHPLAYSIKNRLQIFLTAVSI